MRTKRILFVDDEPLVLQGLQRMLRHMREEWEMVFVESGEAALTRLDQEAFDVVVTDMRMPVMSGAELLNLVLQRHPGVVRIVLSGHADRDLILQCLGATHQYLSKPCEPELLRSTIQRASLLVNMVDSGSVKDLVARMEHLPTPPGVYLRISQLLENPMTTTQEVGELVAQDLGLSAMALKLVNSAFFGLRRQISHPGEAVAYLGLETVKSLALVQGVVGGLDARTVAAMPIPPMRLMEHSLRVAQGARLIAKEEGVSSASVDEAFTAGLLHDCGILVLASGFGGAYREVWQRVRAEDAELLVAEQEAFGANHAQVGAYLLGLWGLPAGIVEAVALHHHPVWGGPPTFGPLAAVHAADALVDHPFDRSLFDHNYLALVGVADRIEAWKTLLATYFAQESAP